MSIDKNECGPWIAEPPTAIERYPQKAVFTDDLTDHELDLLFRLSPCLDQCFISSRCLRCNRTANLRETTRRSGWFCHCGYFNVQSERASDIFDSLPEDNPDQGPSLVRLSHAGWDRLRHPFLINRFPE